MKAEISNPHYHPAHGFDMNLTKRRDLSVPPHWVANERIEKDGKSYAIVMPTRDKELFEERQPIHIHCDRKTFETLGDLGTEQYKRVVIKGKEFAVKVKVTDGYTFEPVIHFDHIQGKELGIVPGEDIAV